MALCPHNTSQNSRERAKRRRKLVLTASGYNNGSQSKQHCRNGWFRIRVASLRDNRSGYVIPRGAVAEGDENERRNHNCGIIERVPSTYRPRHSPLENKKHCTHHERTNYVQGGMRGKSPM